MSALARRSAKLYYKVQKIAWEGQSVSYRIWRGDIASAGGSTLSPFSLKKLKNE